MQKSAHVAEMSKLAMGVLCACTLNIHAKQEAWYLVQRWKMEIIRGPTCISSRCSHWYVEQFTTSCRLISMCNIWLIF